MGGNQNLPNVDEELWALRDACSKRATSCDFTTVNPTESEMETDCYLIIRAMRRA